MRRRLPPGSDIRDPDARALTEVVEVLSGMERVGDLGGDTADDRAGDKPGDKPGDKTVEGVVRAQRPSGLYEIEIDGAHRIVAHVGGGTGRNFVRLLIGDHVVVELMARDLTRGRIVRRLEHGSGS